MSARNTVVRSLHDLGAAAWFGGSLGGAVGVNGSADAVRDSRDRAYRRLSRLDAAKRVTIDNEVASCTPWRLDERTSHCRCGGGVHPC
jgi:hypothetical protein